MYKLKLSALMTQQVIDDNKTFTTEKKAYIHGIERYGSSGENHKYGWSVEHV